MAVEAAIVRSKSITTFGGAVLVGHSKTVGPVQELTSGVKSTIAVRKYRVGKPTYSFTFDGDTGTFVVGEILTIGTPTATAEVLYLGASKTMVIALMSGTVPADNSTLLGQASGATADVAGAVSAESAYYGDAASRVEDLLWRITNSESAPIDIAFGPTPDPTQTANGPATTAKQMVPAGATMWFGCDKFGDHVQWVAS